MSSSIVSQCGHSPWQVWSTARAHACNPTEACHSISVTSTCRVSMCHLALHFSLVFWCSWVKLLKAYLLHAAGLASQASPAPGGMAPRQLQQYARARYEQQLLLPCTATPCRQAKHLHRSPSCVAIAVLWRLWNSVFNSITAAAVDTAWAEALQQAKATCCSVVAALRCLPDYDSTNRMRAYVCFCCVALSCRFCTWAKLW
jgi:hypothetical protein